MSTGLYVSLCHKSRYDEIFQMGFSESLKMLSTYQQVSRHARATKGLSVRLGLGLRCVHQTRTDYESSFLGLVVIVLGQVSGSSRQNRCLYPPKSDRCPDRFMPDVTLSLSFI